MLSTSNKLATLLGTTNTFFSNEVLMMQGYIKMISKSVGTLVVEFDQEGYEAYLSQSRSLAPARACRRIKFNAPVPAHTFPIWSSNANIGSTVEQDDGRQSSTDQVYFKREEPQTPGCTLPPLRWNHNAK